MRLCEWVGSINTRRVGRRRARYPANQSFIQIIEMDDRHVQVSAHEDAASRISLLPRRDSSWVGSNSGNRDSGAAHDRADLMSARAAE